MSKQHFEKIASTLRAQLVHLSTEPGFQHEYDAVRRTILALAEDFAEFNPRFNRYRFLMACGIV